MKKFFALALAALMMVALLAACGDGGSGSTGGGTSGGSSSGGTSSGGGSSSEVEETFEHADLVVSYVMFAPEPADLQLVQDAINEITERDLNVSVTLKGHNVAAYGEQIKLQLIAQEQVDVFITGNMVIFDLFSNQVNNGQLLALDDLMDKYGQGIKEVMGDYASVGMMNGKIYGVPQNRDLAVARSFVYLADVADRNGIKPEDITNFEELEEALAIIKENEPDMYGLHPGDVPSSTANGIYTIDGLDDHMGVLENVFSGDTTVVNLFETDAFLNAAKMAKRWSDNGYQFPDADVSDASPYELMGAGRVFGFLSSYKPGITTQASQRITGNPKTYVSVLSDAWTYSAKVTNFMWSISAHTKDPVQAMRFMNYMYTSEEYMNLIGWGIEGTHYERVEGTEHTIKQISDNYKTGTTWIFGNEMLCYVTESDPDDLRQQMDDFNQGAKASPATGFVFNAENVSNEVAACLVIWNEVNRSIGCGMVDDIDAAAAEISQRLYAAGLQKIMDEKQAQLDAYIAA